MSRRLAAAVGQAAAMNAMVERHERLQERERAGEDRGAERAELGRELADWFDREGPMYAGLASRIRTAASGWSLRKLPGAGKLPDQLRAP